MTEYRSLHPRSRSSMRVGYLAMFLILGVAAAGCLVGSMMEDWLIYVGYAAAALASLFLVMGLVFPRIYYDHYRYYISDDRVDIRCGIIFLRHIVVPIERIHQVEVVAGPVNRIFGLADVRVTTAGGTADISFLEKEEADRIADELNRIVDDIVRGLDR